MHVRQLPGNRLIFKDKGLHQYMLRSKKRNLSFTYSWIYKAKVTFYTPVCISFEIARAGDSARVCCTQICSIPVLLCQHSFHEITLRIPCFLIGSCHYVISSLAPSLYREKRNSGNSFSHVHMPCCSEFGTAKCFRNSLVTPIARKGCNI